LSRLETTSCNERFDTSAAKSLQENMRRQYPIGYLQTDCTPGLTSVMELDIAPRSSAFLNGTK
jgi:hypothetical protein